MFLKSPLLVQYKIRSTSRSFPMFHRSHHHTLARKLITKLTHDESVTSHPVREHDHWPTFHNGRILHGSVLTNWYRHLLANSFPAHIEGSCKGCWIQNSFNGRQ